MEPRQLQFHSNFRLDLWRQGLNLGLKPRVEGEKETRLNLAIFSLCRTCRMPTQWVTRVQKLEFIFEGSFKPALNHAVVVTLSHTPYFCSIALKWWMVIGESPTVVQI